MHSNMCVINCCGGAAQEIAQQLKRFNAES
jgi:hypothetical protein